MLHKPLTIVFDGDSKPMIQDSKGRIFRIQEIGIEKEPITQFGKTRTIWENPNDGEDILNQICMGVELYMTKELIMITDADLLEGIRKACGYVQDGSSQTVQIYQDDACYTWFAVAGKSQFFGNSFANVVEQLFHHFKE
jgi:hypothetical protein